MKKYSSYVVQPLITVVVLLIGLFMYGKLVGPVTIGSDNSSQRTFTVDGQATVDVTPDKYYTDFTINETGTTQEVAKNKGTEKQEKALTELKTLGFAETDIKTTNFSVNPDYNYGIMPERNPTPSGYSTYITTQVTSKDKSKVEKAIDALTALGINVNGVQSTVGDTEEYKDSARLKAVEQAKRKAESLAKAGNFKLGKIASIKEGPDYGEVQPMPGPVLRMDKAVESQAPTQINPGTQQVSAQVSITYYMRD